MEQRGRGRDVPEGKEQKEEGWNGKDTEWVFTGHGLILHENTPSTGLHYVVCVCVCVCLYLGAIQHIRSARSTWWGLAFLRVVGELATDKPDTDRQT